MTAPILMHGSETWVHSQKERNKIQTAEMRFLRKTKGCTRLDRTRNENIRIQLNICSIFGRITNYRNRWKDHINRMEDHTAEVNYEIQAKGKIYVGRPMKRWD
jgi:hypothetical protein